MSVCLVEQSRKQAENPSGPPRGEIRAKMSRLPALVDLMPSSMDHARLNGLCDVSSIVVKMVAIQQLGNCEKNDDESLTG